MSTCPPDAADRLAETLLQERLVACVNICGPVRSRYWWEGEVQCDSESLLLMKTRAELSEALVERLREIHPYAVPEILIVPVEFASLAYLSWVREETRAGSRAADCRPTSSETRDGGMVS